MIDVTKYLDDGANWQAQAVLAYIRCNTSTAVGETFRAETMDYAVKINVGRYENCREQGYVFSIDFIGEEKGTKERKHYQRNYAVYEHRNSDSIIVLISNATTINTPNIDAMWADKGENPSKYDYDKSFDNGNIIDCAKYILSDMKDFIKEHYINEMR